MSLAQHVSAFEGVDREPLEDDAESLLSLSQVPSRRTSRRPSLSYDPIPPAQDPQEKLEPIGAYDVSQSKRLVQVAIGVISCVIAAGIVFGFAALKPVLIGENVYRELCTKKELEDQVVVCYLQDLKLNLTFNVASVTANMSALLVGAILDRFGPRVCGILSSVILTFGTLCMAFERELPFDAIVAGHFLLALGGTFVFVPSFHLSNAFPRYQGLILALITGAFDSSAAVFLIFRLIYESSRHQFALKQFFLLYLVVPVFVLTTQLFLMPNKSYETRIGLQQTAEEAEDPAHDVHSSDEELDDSEMWYVRSLRADDRKRIRAEISSLLGNMAEQEDREKKEEQIRFNSQAWGALHGQPAWRQIRSPWFILITVFTILQMARFNFFIATIWSQYRYMLRSTEMADRINSFFDLALPIGGVAAVPFIGTLLDNLSVAGVLAIVVTLSTAVGFIGTLHYAWAGYMNVVLFCIFRPLYYSAMSDYTVKVFGLATFGTIYGTIICTSGLLTFTQSALQAITHEAFSDNPTPVNLALAGLGLISGAALVLYVAFAGRKVQQEVVEEEERRSLLPTPRETPRLDARFVKQSRADLCQRQIERENNHLSDDKPRRESARSNI
ncbi:MFS transporter, LAT3 family, solute carrier family 43, member 3 [Rhizodiscina lignyota]|uniref:MFS transporter, LAT3 family, solute carrier family 43, member 3 n=1 Tax=Rhizodiscina lignyota TaxID=1504668 RepID=A0A9P4IMF6_9PEZI|nr:MFS transporter, LAT3 family, solute carrier family 43, member 3 [Rhizodiscina lignyota]